MAGELRKPATAIVPIVAAVGGMLVPATIFFVINATQSGGDTAGWAVPVATDIAFAVAVLSIVGKWLPNALRAFLLTLAVVDDLLAIIIIAIFFSNGLSFGWLGASVACIALFWFLIKKGITTAWILAPLAVLSWGFMHASGVHATIAAVALGLAVPAIRRPRPEAKPRRALGALVEAAVGRRGRSDLRALRRGSHDRCRGAAKRRDRSGRPGHRGRARDRKARGDPVVHLLGGHVH